MNKQKYIEENFTKFDDLINDTNFDKESYDLQIKYAQLEGHKYVRFYEGELHSYSDEFMKQSVEELEEHHQSNLALYDLIKQEILFNPFEVTKVEKKVSAVKWFAALFSGVLVSGLLYFVMWLAQLGDNPYLGWIALGTAISSQVYHELTKGDEQQ